MIGSSESKSSVKLSAWLGNAFSAILLFFSFMPLGHPFLALVALVPSCVAASLQPDWRTWRLSAFTTQWVLWIALLIWLRHVYPPLGWLGLILLTGYCALYGFIWLLALRWIFPACPNSTLPARLLAIAGLAGAWGLLEWARSSVFTGFGWLPLAATQAGNPVLLSLCAWIGPTGLSMALVFFNLGMARWLVRLRKSFQENQLTPQNPIGWLNRLTPELYFSFIPLAFGFVALLDTNRLLANAKSDSLTPAIVQTDIAPDEKWDHTQQSQHLEMTETLTAFATLKQTADFVLWPEAALPFTLEVEEFVNRLTQLAMKGQTPLVIGTINRNGEGYSNSVAVVTPQGLQKEIYSKRNLVPFGEYVPFADWLPLRKVVPIESDCVPGTDPKLLPITMRNGRTITAGALVCYEDMFFGLAREHALSGAEVILVVTNDAWYGREAGAYQHAAHSILLASATRLPVIRCGNAGWSGSIDAHGRAYPLLTEGSIYFRGAMESTSVKIPRTPLEPTPWVRYGDWLVGLGGLLFGLTYIWRRRRTY